VTLSPRWQAGIVLALPALLASAWPEGLPALEWERGAIAHGQWGRLLWAHFVHLDAHHLLFNLLGLALVIELLMEGWTSEKLATLILASALGTSLLLWFCEPTLQWYAGLSGLLHGLWAGAALDACLRRRGWLPAGALLALAVKLAWMNHGAGPLPVLPVAHVYGALSGILWALLRHAYSLRRQFD